MIWYEDRVGGGTCFTFSLPLIGAVADDDDAAPMVLVCEADDDTARDLVAAVIAEGCAHERVRSAAEAHAAMTRRPHAAIIVGLTLPPDGGQHFTKAIREEHDATSLPVIVVATVVGDNDVQSSALDVVDWIVRPVDLAQLSVALRKALAPGDARQLVVLHLDDDRDLLAVVAAALEPEARTVGVTDLASARAMLRTVWPDVAILDVKLANGSGLDLIPFLVGTDGISVPTIIYSAQDLTGDQDHRADAVLVKARGSIPDLKAAIRRIVRTRPTSPAQ